MQHLWWMELNLLVPHFAIHNLCKYPEHLEPLRREIANLAGRKCKDDHENLPLLDSFLKESARTDPLDSRKCRPRRDELLVQI